MTTDDFPIFISYASPDRDRVLSYLDHLQQMNFNVWVDFQSIKPGQNWDFEIRRAFSKATFILAFVSNNSVSRRGYVQRELKMALDMLQEKLIDDIYIIPVILDDDVTMPVELSGIQYVKASDPECKTLIVGALNHQIERLNSRRNQIQQKEDITWTTRTIDESWDGLPGYNVKIQYLELHSGHIRNIHEISEYIKGEFLSTLFQHRVYRIRQSPEFFKYDQNKYSRTNNYDAFCGEPTIIGNLISIQYAINWYGAGAMHPNHSFRAFNFLLEPLVPIESLIELFEDPKEVFPILQEEVRKCLYEILCDSESATSRSKRRREWINKGTENWDGLDTFAFTETGLEIMFAPYRVADYASGSHSCFIPYTMLVPSMKSHYVNEMKLGHFLP